LKPVNLVVRSKKEIVNGKCILKAEITNPSSSKAIAFAIHVQVLRSSDGERVLPLLMNDNYFSLLKGETKELTIEFEESLLSGSEPELSVVPFNK